MHKGLGSAGKQNPNPTPKREPKNGIFLISQNSQMENPAPLPGRSIRLVFSRKMPQNGLPAAAAPTEPKDRGVKSGSFGPKRLENDGSSRRGLKFPKKSSPKIGDFLESGWGWIPPHFATGAYWGRLPPAPNSPFLVLRTKPTPKSDPETPPWNEIRHFRPHEAGGGIWRGEKKTRKKNSKSIREVFVTLTKKKNPGEGKKRLFLHPGGNSVGSPRGHLIEGR